MSDQMGQEADLEGTLVDEDASPPPRLQVPLKSHLIHCAKYGTRRDTASLNALLAGTNDIWQQAGIELVHIGSVSVVGTDEAAEAAMPKEKDSKQKTTARQLLPAAEFDSGAVHLLLLSTILWPDKGKMIPQNWAGLWAERGLLLCDKPSNQESRVLAMALGWLLGLKFVEAAGRLMRRTQETALLIPEEIEQARARVTQWYYSAPARPPAAPPAPKAPLAPAAPPAPAPDADAALSEALRDLSTMIGLDDVKNRIRTLANFLKLEKTRAGMGLSRNTMALHSVFSGNPGTGKTTVARHLGQIFKALGLLARGHVVEADRATLVEPGQTPARVKKAVDEAMDGVLFIDEAYTLSPKKGGDQLGLQAINMLVKLMEDAKDRLVVVVAGYPEEMDGFLEANAGLKSRFTQYFDFPDYGPAELRAIFEAFCRERGFVLEPAAEPRLAALLQKAYDERERTFGNARLVRNVFEEALGRQANRLAGQGGLLTREQVTCLQAADLPDIKTRFAVKTSHEKTSWDPSAASISRPPVGDTLDKVMAELDAMIGMAGVKQQVRTLINFLKVDRMRQESGLARTPVSMHVVFSGPPGTGKTTVARLLGRIYKCLGMLEKGQVLETDRSGLVAGWVGQTALKTNEAIDKALDGVLFIDEAYALADKSAQHNFCMEAVNTLLKRMEDAKDRLAVVAAGYPREMDAFLEANPGLASRFNQRIDFEDYSPDELAAIFDFFCQGRGFTLSEAARERLRDVLEKAWKARDRTFGNGRLVRNIFEKTVERQANRLMGNDSPTPADLTGLEAADIEEPGERRPAFVGHLLCSHQSSDATQTREAVLADLAALEVTAETRKQLLDHMNLVAVEQMRHNDSRLPLNLLFCGPPGSGRMRAAMLVTRYYHAIGAIETCNLADTAAPRVMLANDSDMVTAVNRILTAANGGVLFVDDAHELMTVPILRTYVLGTLLSGGRHGYKCPLILAGPTDWHLLVERDAEVLALFRRRVVFTEPEKSELERLFDSFCKERGYRVAATARERLAACLQALESGEGGTAREAQVRHLFETTIAQQASRVVAMAAPDSEVLSTIEADDVAGLAADAPRRLGIRQSP